ncbi:MAG: YqiA/YcfP family alpha/beta fold hydrolase [Ginsengibacter sp.]|jgi:hypothetical protein
MIEINNLTEGKRTGESPTNREKRPVETIFYFHGFNGFLTHEKREVLQQFGKVIAPTFNYSLGDTLSGIINSFKDVDLKSAIFMGTSYGGYVINVLNEKYDIPGLLFNPALPYRILIEPNREHYFENNLKSLSSFVLGKKDKLVRYQDNLDYISKYVKGPKEVILNEDLGHSIPVKEFEIYTRNFLEKVV